MLIPEKAFRRKCHLHSNKRLILAEELPIASDAWIRESRVQVGLECHLGIKTREVTVEWTRGEGE